MRVRRRGKAKVRDTVRVSTSIPVRLVVVSPEGTFSERGWFEGEIVDVGGGGARIKTLAECDGGDVVVTRFSMPDSEEELSLSGKVVRACEEDDVAMICVKFVGISVEEEKCLLRYAFRTQIKEAKDSHPKEPPTVGCD